MMRIGDVAAGAGVSVRSLRYYEEQGLIRAERSPSGQRQYAPGVVGRVRLIQHFYAAGLPSRSIARILAHADSGESTATVEALLAERERLAAAIADLEGALGRLDVVIDHAGRGAPAAGACL